VSEVVIGVQFQSPALTPVHMGLYFQEIRQQFPIASVQPPIAPMFETFEAQPGALAFPLPFPFAAPMPRMWFASEDGASLIQLQTGRLLFNWRGGLVANAYPHFNAVQAGFTSALDKLDALIKKEGFAELVVNQCELSYINPILVSSTGVPFSEVQKIFRVWSGEQGEEWTDTIEDLSFTMRYRFNDEHGAPFGRLRVALAAGITADGSQAFQLELTARGRPLGEGRSGIAAFHDHAHQSIVRCFTAITTGEMHKLWDRYQ
jgi:uncharacterized protein (TIGR04255 family)